MKKIIYIPVLLIIIGTVSFFFMWMQSSANPDYICIKDVVNQPCTIANESTDCTSWSTDWKRTCTWTQTTKVAYYLIRTSCEAWYTKVARWSSWWTSWRNSADYPYASEVCTIQQIDNTNPVGEVK